MILSAPSKPANLNPLEEKQHEYKKRLKAADEVLVLSTEESVSTLIKLYETTNIQPYHRDR